MKKQLILITIVMLFIFLICLLCLMDYPRYDAFELFIESSINPIKPYMWVYWEQVNGSPIPPYITLCLDIMKKNGSKYFNVTLLNENTIFDFLPDLRKDINDLPIALKTDYIRVRLLELYGGMWIDADTILMKDLKEIADLINRGVDYIGCGCTGPICKNMDGYGKPSNSVMGSIKGGKLITRCRKNLDDKLNAYYATLPRDRKKFDYFDLGKKIIWEEYDKLIVEDPDYEMYHIPSYSDGSRDIDGKWVAPNVIFKDPIRYTDRSKLLVVLLANSIYCSKDTKYNWFCKLSRDEILNGPGGGEYFVSGLFNEALNYGVLNNGTEH